MTVADTAILTAEEYLQRSNGSVATELVRGRIVEINRPHTAHGYFVMQIAGAIQQYLQGNDIGRMGGGRAGIVTRREPDTVRGPDISFYSYERIPRGPLPTGYWPAAPELVVEVLSPERRWKDTFVKASEYLDIGTLTVAIANPQTHRLELFSADQAPATLNANDKLTFPDILPGFKIPVAKLLE